MSERSPEDFVRAAQIRLELAASMYERARHLPFSAGNVEMANVAMFLWSAGIDMISAHMLLNGETRLGRSVSRRRYLVKQILSTDWPVQLQSGWSVLSRLHNFQHNLDMRETAFTTNCRESASFFARLSNLLPVHLRLPSDAYAWLADVE